jgi:hypothetical protein
LLFADFQGPYLGSSGEGSLIADRADMSETLRISNRDDIDWTTTSNIQYSASGILHEEPTPLVPAWMDWEENWQLICNTTLIESQQTNRCHREGSPQDLKSCPCKQPDGRGKADVVSAPERIDLPNEAFLSSVKFRGVNSGASQTVQRNSSSRQPSGGHVGLKEPPHPPQSSTRFRNAVSGFR